MQVAVPGQAGASAASVAAPPDAVGVGGSFAYPSDGTVVNAGSVTSGAFASPGDRGDSDFLRRGLDDLDLRRGRDIGTVTAKARASASTTKSSGDSGGSGVSGLVVQGQAVAPGAGTSFPLGDWGSVVTLQQGLSSLDTNGSPGTRAFVTGVQVTLSVDHYGYPAGTSVMIGYAEAGAKATIAQKPPTNRNRRAKAPPKQTKRVKKHKTAPPPVAPEKPSLTVRPPPDVTPRLTAGGYVFPVYGPSSFGDTFGAPRGDLTSGWHHGADIFGQIGEPLLAVADGTVFSVGWNDIGGYRLWLRDRAGNQFYYAHLSAYSPVAVNGRQVKAGAVLGFMGNTGDASTTPYHLHFEIHPVSLLYLGYDGAVNPTPT